MQSFVKIKPSRNGKITLSFIDIGKPCLSRDFFYIILICLLLLFAKIKFTRKFPNLQYQYLQQRLSKLGGRLGRSEFHCAQTPTPIGKWTKIGHIKSALQRIVLKAKYVHIHQPPRSVASENGVHYS